MADSLEERAHTLAKTMVRERLGDRADGPQLDSFVEAMAECIFVGYLAAVEDAARVADGIQSVSEENRRTFALVGGVVARHIRALVSAPPPE